MEYNIIELDKAKWAGHRLDFDYTTDEYYDLDIERKPDGWGVNLVRKKFSPPFHKKDAGYDKLYQPHWANAVAYGVVEGEKLLGVIEIFPEKWNNRNNITELWIEESHRRQGMGKALMDFAKEKTREARRRMISLETQTCNTSAIDFYLSQGFDIIGFDTCDYNNDDIKRREVHLDMGWFAE